MNHLSERTTGRLCVMAAAALWSTNGLFVKSPLFVDWPPEQRGLLFAFWRSAFAALALAAMVRAPKFGLHLAPLVLAFVALNWLFLQSMVWTTAANAIWLQNIAPLWVCVLARLSGESLNRRDLPMVGLALAGVGLILTCELSGTDWSHDAPRGVLLGFLSGIAYAMIVHYLRRLRDADPAWLIVVSLAITAVCFSPAPLATGIWPQGRQWPMLVAFGAVQLAAPYYLFARGLRRISSQEGSCLALLEPVLVPVWVYLMYRERTEWWTAAGGALILAGLLWRYRPARSELEGTEPPVSTDTPA